MLREARVGLDCNPIRLLVVGGTECLSAEAEGGSSAHHFSITSTELGRQFGTQLVSTPPARLTSAVTRPQAPYRTLPYPMSCTEPYRHRGAPVRGSTISSIKISPSPPNQSHSMPFQSGACRSGPFRSIPVNNMDIPVSRTLPYPACPIIPCIRLRAGSGASAGVVCPIVCLASGCCDMIWCDGRAGTGAVSLAPHGSAHVKPWVIGRSLSCS